MSKYENNYSTCQNIDLKQILTNGEYIIWSGKPKQSAFIINQALTMFPFALLWLLFDSIFIIGTFSSPVPKEIIIFLIFFFAIHLTPVWIWLSNVLTSKKKWNNTKYAITDRRIIIITGFIGMSYESIYYQDISNVNLKISIIDKLLHVGDIYFYTNNNGSVSFLDIENVYEIYPKIQKIVLDIQTDINFPNNLRPDENNGYNTKYN